MSPSLPTGLLVGLIGLLVVACGGRESELTIKLEAAEVSTQAGIATLRAQGGRTEVVLKVDAGPAAGDPQPVHIHFGTCGPNLGSVHYPLEDVVEGESTTVIQATLSALTDGNHSVNLHKSYDEVSVYTACGDIPRK